MFSFRRITLLFSIFIFAFQQSIFSQDKFEIIPGKSVGAIKIGQNKDSVLKYVLAKYTEKTFLEEKKNFADSDLEVSPQFVLGFDKVITFEDFPVYQVFKVYFKQDSLNYIMLTSYGFGSEKTIKKYKTDKKVGFNDDPKKVIKIYGEPEKIVTLTDEIDYIYWSKGIEFVIEENKVTVIYIFKPIIIPVK